MNTKPKNLLLALEDYASVKGNQRFLFDESHSLTASEVLTRVVSLAVELRQEGVQSGDFVIFRATRSVPSALLFLALESLGAVAVFVDSRLAKEDFLSPSFTSIDYQFALWQEDPASPWSDFSLVRKNGSPLSVALASESKNSPLLPDSFPDVSESTPGFLVFTTGSTEKKKPVLLSQGFLMEAAFLVMGLGLYQANDTGLMLLPMSHIFGLFLIVAALLAQHALYFPVAKDGQSILTAISTYHITRLDGVPTLFLAAVEAQEKAKQDISSLRQGMIGAGPCSAVQMARIEVCLGIQLIPVYGMTESLGISAGRLGDSPEKRYTTLGKPYPTSDVRILTQNGKEVTVPEVTGEIVCKTPCQMLGYYQQPELTQKARTPAGYLKTGDLGYLDREGYLHLVGRKKNIIIKGGENLSPEKIANALLSLKEVEDGCVVSLPDDYYGEVPAAAVVLAPSSQLTESDLKASLSGLLFRNEIPTRIVIVDQLPLFENGKVDAQAVKEIFSHDN
jgi:acyl-CoA synthetase (AMP-forming)/AMP-acid ligase II